MMLLCFLTGLYSHFLQDPQPWMRFPTRPANLYQVTQGLHVTTGIALIPVLLAKLWAVYPRLFAWPPISTPRHALERLSIAVLVAACLLEVAMGLANPMKWYPWPFPFRETHYALAWLIVASLLIHVAVQLPIIRQHWHPSAADGEVPQ